MEASECTTKLTNNKDDYHNDSNDGEQDNPKLWVCVHMQCGWVGVCMCVWVWVYACGWVCAFVCA